MKQPIIRNLVLCLLAGMLTWGCAAVTERTGNDDTGQKQDGGVYQGEIVGRSDTAKTISIRTGRGKKTGKITLSFDSDTRGLDFASEGRGAIISWQMRDGRAHAIEIKPRLTRLPPGVAEISVSELKDLLDRNVDLLLIDSRPEERYTRSHLPGAVSIPVCGMDELVSQLPVEKDRFLVFYCGGPT